MSARTCPQCQGPMPPKKPGKHRTYCSPLCSSRAFGALDKPRLDEIRAKLPGTCAYCDGSLPEGSTYCDRQCYRKHYNELREAREKDERHAAREAPQPCLDCGEIRDRISYGGGLRYCTHCIRQRDLAFGKRKRAGLKNPNLPMPRSMRRLVELLGQGPATPAALAKAAGPNGASLLHRYTSGLAARGLLVRVRLGQDHWFALAGPQGDALLAAAQAILDAEAAYRAAWQAVLAARAALDALIVQPAPAVTKAAPALASTRRAA